MTVTMILCNPRHRAIQHKESFRRVLHCSTMENDELSPFQICFGIAAKWLRSRPERSQSRDIGVISPKAFPR